MGKTQVQRNTEREAKRRKQQLDWIQSRLGGIPSVYAAFVSNPTTPTAIVAHNGLGETMTWSKDATGTYVVTAGSAIFTDDSKVNIQLTSSNPGSNPADTNYIGYVNDVDNIWIEARNAADSGLENELNVYIEIKIYA